MLKDQRLIARLTSGEKALLVALRRQDYVGEGDLLATLLVAEARRRIADRRATDEIRRALAHVEQEPPKATNRPPALPREVALEPTDESVAKRRGRARSAMAQQEPAQDTPPQEQRAEGRTLDRTEHAILVSAVEPKGLPLARKSRRVLQTVRAMRDEGLLTVRTEGDDERAHATEAGRAALWASFARKRDPGALREVEA